MNDFVLLFKSRAGVEDAGAETSPAWAWEKPIPGWRKDHQGPLSLVPRGSGHLPSRLWQGEAQRETGEKESVRVGWVSGVCILLSFQR